MLRVTINDYLVFVDNVPLKYSRLDGIYMDLSVGKTLYISKGIIQKMYSFLDSELYDFRLDVETLEIAGFVPDSLHLYFNETLKHSHKIPVNLVLEHMYDANTIYTFDSRLMIYRY
jgi:hypothetical protein